jgi:hypothetical protein
VFLAITLLTLDTAGMRKKRARQRKSDQRRNHQKRATKSLAERPHPVRVVAGPGTQMNELLTLMIEVGAAADHAVAATAVTDHQLTTFDVAVFVRGINALKSARLLLAESFWEAADAQVRQLFELVINMEHLAALPDRRAASLQYARFGLLQKLRAQRRTMTYAEATDRAVDRNRLDLIDQLLSSEFEDFALPDRQGEKRWRASWSGKNAFQLASASSSEMRVRQYQQLFSAWSEQIHAAPGALLDGILRTSDLDWIDRIMTEDAAAIMNTASMAIPLFLELWQLLPNVKQSPPEQMLQWIEYLQHLYGQHFQVDVEAEREHYLSLKKAQGSS